jgi:hypothetical protein
VGWFCAFDSAAGEFFNFFNFKGIYWDFLKVGLSVVLVGI